MISTSAGCVRNTINFGPIQTRATFVYCLLSSNANSRISIRNYLIIIDSIGAKELKYNSYHFTVVRFIHDHMGIANDRQRWRSGYFIAELCDATELQVEMQ